MKKLLGILALTLAASALASAANAREQDYFESINWNTEYRMDYQDVDNGIGNEGFKSENSKENVLRNTLSGTLNLQDEWGLKADFSILSKTYDKKNFVDSDAQGWETDLNVRKSIKLGNYDTDFTLIEWKRWEEEGQETNELLVGPKFSINVLGQNVSVTTKAVYYKEMAGSKEASYYVGGTEGYGANVDFGFGGNIYQGDYGTLSYAISLANHWRNATGDNDYKNNWKLDYETTVDYKTPSFWGGFYAGTELYNEWIRHTASGKEGLSGFSYTNEFNVTPYLGYKTSFSTPVGELAVNPYVKYRAFQRFTSENGYSDNERLTEETDRFTAGLSLGLNLD